MSLVENTKIYDSDEIDALYDFETDGSPLIVIQPAVPGKRLALMDLTGKTSVETDIIVRTDQGGTNKVLLETTVNGGFSLSFGGRHKGDEGKNLAVEITDSTTRAAVTIDVVAREPKE